MTDFSLAFLGMFESLRMGPTFARGRRDERAGHVRSLTVSGSLAVALVRGPDDPVSFRARIAVRSFGAAEWARVETALVAEARFTAELLNGRMPPGIEAVFDREGLSLLPLSFDEVALDCSCERWPMPCIHLAATCYALARAFETDPFEVFTWRGRSRDELLMRLRRLREATAVADPGGAGSSAPGFPAPGFSAAGFSARGAPSASDLSESGVGAASSAFGGSSSSSSSSSSAGREAAEDPATFWGSGFGDFGTGDADSGNTELGDARPGDPGPGDPVSRRVGSSGIGSGGPDEKAAGARPDALLDQLDAPGLTHEGRSIVDVLRPAYQALPDSGLA